MEIEFVSERQSVSMADDWFEIASPDHFWMRRRFEVFRRCMEDQDIAPAAIAEIGCGNGVVQGQMGEWLNLQTDGFDLNELALKQSVAKGHTLYLYNVLEKLPRFNQKYDLIILFDVLEHVEDPAALIDAAHYMLKPEGRLAINLPAHQALFSNYDQAAGHLMRYNKNSLGQLMSNVSFKLMVQTYWGFGLIPVLFLRKLVLMFHKNQEKIIKAGFEPPNKIVQRILYLLSRFEMIPQQFAGSSIMAIFQKVG